jgi:hypothetical protein
MANTFDQSILQSNDIMGKRIITQYENNDNNPSQIVVEYADLTDEQKIIFDAFEELSKSLMV